MPPSGFAQRESDAQKEAFSLQNQDGSLESSDLSSQSRGSFDFNKMDRLGDTLRTPGIVRPGVGDAAHGSLPDEKGFSIQIGSELFKLSGASIMSDGRLGRTLRKP